MISFRWVVGLSMTLLLVAFLVSFRSDHFEIKSGVDKKTGQGWVRWILPGKYREISGLALYSTKLVFHTDEKGRIYLFNPETDEISEWFRFPKRYDADFEAVAILEDNLYLLTSEAVLYRVENLAGIKQGTIIEPEVIDTFLSEQCEFEGLDTFQETLLLLCKTNYVEKDSKNLIIWSWSPESGEKTLLWRISHNLANVLPSALTVAGDIAFVVDSKARLLIELQGERIRSIYQLKKKRHPQPEGLLLVEKDGLYIADEGAGKKHGYITRYYDFDVLRRL